MTRLAASATNEEFVSALDTVVRGERVIVQRQGKDVAALVSIEDLDQLHDSIITHAQSKVSSQSQPKPL